MKHMYLDLEFKFKNEATKNEHVIETFVKEFSDYVILKLPTMAVYFEEYIKATTKTYFNKDVEIRYDSSVQLKFYAYREFMHKYHKTQSLPFYKHY